MSIFHTRWLRSIRSILGTMALAPAFAHADDLRLESTSLPAPLLEDGKVNVVVEASALEPIGDGRRLLVAHDKDPALYVVDIGTGRILGEPITSPRFPKKNEGGPKWEGMARDSEGNFYLIGAHNGKTDAGASNQERPDSVSPQGQRSARDRRCLDHDMARRPFAGGRPEGRRTRRRRGRQAKSRRPDDPRTENRLTARPAASCLSAFASRKTRSTSSSADISACPLPDAELELKPAFAFPAEPREGQASELTSLEYVPALGGFLVVTASEDTANAFHGNTLWFVADGETSHARKSRPSRWP